MPDVTRGFLAFAVKPGTARLLLPGVFWVAKAVEFFDSYDWRDGIEDSLVNFLEVCRQRESAEISANAELREAFLGLLSTLVSHGGHAAIALRDRSFSLSEDLGRVSAVASVPAVQLRISEWAAPVQVSLTPAPQNHPCAPTKASGSAKARNRGPERARYRRCDLWGFEACDRLVSRGRNYGRTALGRVDQSRGACAAGIGIRFGVAAAIARRWRSIIERAPSALARAYPY